MASGNQKTAYAGVTFRVNQNTAERTYYIRYRRGGRGSKETCEPVGKSSAGMTAAKASQIRADRIRGKEATNREQRQAEKRANECGIGPLTFNRVWELYQEAHAGKASLKGDQCRYRNHLAGRLGDKAPEAITTEDMDALRNAMSKKGYAAQTIKHAMGQVRRILRFGARRGLFTISPALHFDMPEVDNEQTESLNDAQLASYLHALEQETDTLGAAFLRLILATGMRRGALLHLKWEDVDFERSELCLRGAYAKKGKTDFIPLIKAAKDILQSLPRISPYVFSGKDCTKPREDFRRVARRVRERAGLPRTFRPLHGLRHAYASALISSGKVSLYELQKLLTHENASMTQRYAHLADEAKKRVAEVAGDIFFPTK